MSPLQFPYAGSLSTCRLGPKGRLSIPQQVLDDLGWKVGDRFNLKFSKDPIIIHLTPHPEKYTLSYLTHKPHPSGGLLNLRSFTKKIVSPYVVLPKEGLAPLYVPTYEGLTVMVTEPTWVELPFSANGVREVSTAMRGVYQILSSRNHTLESAKVLFATASMNIFPHQSLLRKERHSNMPGLNLSKI